MQCCEEKGGQELHSGTTAIKLSEVIKGKGKNKTQRIVIHYRFVGVIEKPVDKNTERIILESRKGVAVEYLTA